MSRKRKAPVRKIYPDPKFHSEIVSKFINSIMYDGKRSTAEKILYDALEKIKTKNNEDKLIQLHFDEKWCHNMYIKNYTNIEPNKDELIKFIENIVSKKLRYEYIDEPRKGDHKWYISDISKFKKDYPNWKISLNIEDIILDIYQI